MSIAGTQDAAGTPPEIDWAGLRRAALAAARRAYAPYSGYAVGCAALVDDGRVISGCNVENASYGVTLCAECVLVGQLHLGGGSAGPEAAAREAGGAGSGPPRLVAFDCVNGAGETITPCGRCRQLLREAAAPGMRLNTPAGLRTIEEMLPESFGPANLA
ncbi:cytidine deaminase [Leucobacter allii]|uniref:cytidine deaminase n=1 Tax=Leucobacter allii TaxID=2932247 RepID=UPI001FD18C6A|nr:cytidine deaminase [Leucobacter allii]UOR01255.1 cytidine deaminase [Leucobacter allii]